MPVVHKKVKHDSQPRWMNDEIRTAIKTRDFHNKKTHFVLYKPWRNKVVHIIRVLKKKILYYSYERK